MKIFTLSVCGRLTLDLHNLNNEGTEGNQQMTRMVSVVVEADGALHGLPAVFIRAPRIVRVGPEVEVLARVHGDPVLVRSGAIWAATFHPELTDDDRVLRAWLAPSPPADASRTAA